MEKMNRYLFSVIICTVLLFYAIPAFSVSAPFYSPPQTSGSIPVRLYPTEHVSLGKPTLVTFGMPFTRGSITESDLDTVRLISGGNTGIEIYIDQLSTWRHVSDTAFNGTSVRVARLQFVYTFSVSYPDYETITLEWGMKNRTNNRSIFQNPRSAWHLVESGTYEAEDNVFEPDVYAVLPKEILCNGSISTTRMLPFDDSVSEKREAPEVFERIQNKHGYEIMDHAQHNFFFTIINRDNSRVKTGNQCPYKTMYEPWLYDRSTAMYMLYMRSGSISSLREAVRNTQFYKNNLYDDTASLSRFTGLFKLKNPALEGYPTGNGAMYSYNECLAYTYWLTCDEDMLNPIEWVVNAHERNDEATRWYPSIAFWTERHTALRLLANTVAYEITGKDVYRDSLISQYGDFIWHQNGAGGMLPDDRIDGGLWHFGSQHGDGGEKALVASSWMTVLTVNAMVRAYAFTEDRDIADFIRRTGDFELAACKRDEMHSYGAGPLWYCDYMVRSDGSSEVRSGHTIEHSLEIASAVAWAAYFADLLNADDEPYINCADKLFASYKAGVQYWIRPNAPNERNTVYRVSPWRKYGWEYRPSGSLSWIMNNLK
ncbi:hypothetical protein ACFL6P_03035 [Candidatus Latescibacterota bacterium]